MNPREKKKLTNDIEALIHISDNIARSFDFKAKELRDKYQKEISQYTKIKELLEGKPLDIKFQMEYLNENWTVSIPGCPGFDVQIIPGEILTHITANTDNTGIIKMLRDFETEDGRKFNIYFEKTSEQIISGAITESRENFAAYTDFKDTPTSNQKTKMGKLEELFIYMKDNEDFCNWLISQFYKNWKPLIDKGCFNENSQG